MHYTLHNYFRSSTSARVRMALALKGIEYTYKSYSLLENEHRDKPYLALNPEGLVPALETQDGTISQSMAILEYLEDVHPTPALLPSTPIEKARVRSLAHSIALDIHPVNNLRLLRYIRSEFGADDEGVAKWFKHWVKEMFVPLEKRLSMEADTGDYCHGSSPTIADVCLVAQVANNQRFNVSMKDYPTINRINALCLESPAFQAGMPMNQPDAPTS
ncbi:MAG: maleylacetoacetate isomerase [Gammaproteobacteria bacterium]|nr:maleylacetoacetate isomerase [Gammaproteobacteria bacterium]